MKIDLTAVAGFPLELDTDALDIDTSGGDGIRFDRDVRRRRQMQSVLLEPDAVSDETDLYYNMKMASAGPYADIFQRCNLTFACVLLPPLKVGQEYVKSHGHYHPNMPGSTLAYPEVYTHYYGKLYLLMHRRINETRRGWMTACSMRCSRAARSPFRPAICTSSSIHQMSQR